MRLKQLGILIGLLLLLLNNGCKKKSKDTAEPAPAPTPLDTKTYGEFIVMKRQLCTGSSLTPTWQYNRAVMDYAGQNGYLFWGYGTFTVDSIRLNSTSINLIQGGNYCDSTTINPPYSWKISNSDPHFSGFAHTASGTPQSITGAILPDTVFLSKNTTIKLTGTANADEVHVSLQCGFGVNTYVMSVSDDSLFLTPQYNMTSGTGNIKVIAYKNDEVYFNNKKFIFRVGHSVEKNNVVFKP